MTPLQMRLLAAAAMFTAPLAATDSSQAQVSIYGGVSSLAPAVLQRAAECFGAQAPLLNPGAAPTSQPPGAVTVTVSGVTSTTNCTAAPALPSVQINMETAGERLDVQAVFQNSPSVLGAFTSAAGVANQLLPTLHFATSAFPIPDADVATYNAGGTYIHAITKTVGVAAPGTSPAAGQTANPAARFGPLVQIPIFIAPIAVVYSPVYKKVVAANGAVTSYSFNITAPVRQGLLRLDRPTYCKIFNGQITNWNDPAIQATNGAPILDSNGNVIGYQPIYDPKDPDVLAGKPFSVPIELVGRSDVSGENMIFTRALAAQCSGLTGVANQYADATLILPTTLTAAGGTAAAGSGQFTTRARNSLVAPYIAFSTTPKGPAGTELVQGRIGYITPDWAAPYNTTYGLSHAALASYTDPLIFLEPTAETAQAAYSNITLPADVDPIDPANWAQPASKTAQIAAPTAKTGYPIVGAEQILAYTCYADTQKSSDVNVGYRLNEFIGFLLRSPLMTAKTGILASNGFSPLPSPLRVSAYNEFVSNANGDNLFVSPKSDVIQATGATKRTLFAHNPVCDAYAGD